jgi:two-component system CheB/CheR fusion protein
MSKKKSDIEPTSQKHFPIVGIGASAGGLEAVKDFLSAVPKNTGMTFVFVQHLSPNHESFLPEILQKFAKIPVQQITDDIKLEQDNLYIIPANKIVVTVDGVLKLDPLDPKRPKKKVIDIFFSSLAVVHQSYAIGVILSGTLNDGTVGLQVIKAYGGMTFAQDENSAAFDGMPKSAVSSGAVDFILPPAEIASHLISINHPFEGDYTSKPKKDPVQVNDEEIFKQLLTVLRVRRGVDFTYYKPSTLKRRIVRRMALNNLDKPADYLNFLRDSKNEQDALYNDMLISVTNFFRDPASFDLLCNTIFPSIVKQKANNEPLRIWVAGCATGEEAYSMAICLQEQFGDKTAAMKIQIFATDISETAIAKARSGIYRATDLEGLSTLRIEQFFTKLDGSYSVNKIIRDMCVFAHHNLLKDPPFSKMDLISCRNVLIYLEPILQKRAITTFHYALNDPGFLMLGKSESISKNTDFFIGHNNNEKIFKRNSARGRFMHVASQGTEQSFKNIDKSIKIEEAKLDIFKIADELVLSKFAPAGVLVNEHFDIMQFRGATDIWLTPAPGKASLNVLKMTREGLAFELRNLLHFAKKTNSPARKQNILFNSKGEHKHVNVEVAPLANQDDLHYLILFEESKLVQSVQPIVLEPQSYADDLKDMRIAQLEKELMQAHLDMRTITEEQEAVNEELQSANQELLSGSEELQSLNEELETSKEELQSTNEEISIVNNELVDRNEQLNNARNYSEGIINTIRDPLIVLDKDLKVIRATEGFYNKFKVTEKETEGRYIYELGSRQWDIPELRELLEGILPEKRVVVDFEVIAVFPTIGRRVMCLNSRQLERVNGDQFILLAIEDLTDKRKVEEGLAEVELLFKESKERLKLAVEAAGLGTWDYNPLTGELIWDSRCKELFGLLPEHQIDYQQFISMIHPDDRTQVDAYFKYALSGVNNGEYEKEFKVLETLTNKSKWIKFKGKAYFDESGNAYRFVGTSLDITVQRTHDEAINELLKQKDDFISIASHELKTPITTLKASLQIIDRIKANPNPEKMDNLIELSIKSLDKVSILIEDLLNVSKLNQGQLHMSKKQFKLANLVSECCNYVKMQGQYTITLTGDQDLEVFADADRIEQVIVNFVNNAIKYAPKSKEIIIDIQKEDTFAKLSVKDQGQGISDEKLTHLFERYYRVDDHGHQTSGLGLGLYICSEIIKKHNGKIGVNSKIGKGSTFWFTLPLLT